MKTEKRLTMALSVLVALMMLAVPLASSSNLFVDGGQTNSNGDAPSLGASTGYTITFQLNADGKSLDQIENLNDTTDTNGNVVKGVISKLNDLNYTTGVSQWYLNENGDLCALVMYDKDDASNNVHIQTLINALFDATNDPVVSKITKGAAYTLTSWKDAKSNLSYEYSKFNGADNSAVINSDMTFAAQWELKEEKYVEVPVNVVVDGETKEYYKAYELKGANLNQVEIDKGALNQAILDAAELSLFGIVPNNTSGNEAIAYMQIYKDGIVTYGNGSELPDDFTISSKNTLTVTYTFDDKKYSKLTVSSAAFEDGKDVTLYVDKASASLLMYGMVLEALFACFTESEDGTYEISHDPETADVKPILTVESADEKEGTILTDDGYLLTGWNDGAELLFSMNLVPSGTTQVTLDAELNGYYVIFMSKGQFEYVYVPFGELSADLATTLDVEGVNHWAYLEYKNSDDSKSYEKLSESSKFTTFTSFTDSIISTFDGFGKTAVASETPKQPVAVIVACFDLSSKTSYAVFDANAKQIVPGESSNPDALEPYADGDFGNKYVDKIIISGTASGNTKNIIPLPAVSPVYEDEVVFINYVKYSTADGKYSSTPYMTSGDSAASFGDAEKVVVYNADVVKYKYAVTFYNGSDVVGKFYYDGDLNGSSNDMNAAGFVAFTYNGVSYKASDLNKPDDNAQIYNKDRYDAATKAYNNILYPAKDGYKIIQWKDADGNVMLDKVKKVTSDGETVITYEVKFKKVSSDMSFYANFEAKKYTIIYSGNTATATNNMKQTIEVDKTVNLFKDSTFSNSGYTLKEWNTRPDGDGTSYALGASFTLNGEQFEELETVQVSFDGTTYVTVPGFTLYAIWEKSSSGSGSGDNNEGNDGNNTDTYLLAGILAVIIILIILIAFLMRRKQ